MDRIMKIGSLVTTLRIAATLPARARHIQSWDNTGFATVTGKTVKSIAKESDYWIESVYSIQTRNYVLFVLPDRTRRTEAFDVMGNES